MKLNEKTYLKRFLNVNSNNIYTSRDTKGQFERIDITSNNAAIKIKLSGRIRGVSMARQFKMSSADINGNILELTDKREKILNKIEIKKRKRKNIVSNLHDKKTYTKNTLRTSNKNVAIKPQTLNSIGSYRLQYINKEIYTKWGVFGLKIWLYNKS